MRGGITRGTTTAARVAEDGRLPAGRRRSLPRRTLLGIAATGLGAAPVGALGAWWYGTKVEPGWLEVARVAVSLPPLPRALAGLTIAHLSDMHVGRLVGPERVRAAVDATLGLRPDLIALTGDYVSSVGSGELELLAAELSRLRAPLGVFAVLGNHDHWTGPDLVAAALRRAGAVVLRNGCVPLQRAGATLHVAGVDDVWEDRDDLPAALRGVPPEACVVLLAHEPDFADEAAADPRVALQLSGHSHGGQIRVPGRGAPRLPFLAVKYPEGLHRVGSLQVYTNRGVGVVGPGVRLNCRPEVTLLELNA